MSARRAFLIRIPWLLCLLLAAVPRAHAEMPVIDVSNLLQLYIQAQTLDAQLATARADLVQAQAAVQAITGGRGMQQLLAGTVRNYLPADAASLAAAESGGGTLGADVQAGLSRVSVLSDPQLASLSDASSQQIASQRRSIALMQAIAREALAHSSQRFGSLQQLIDAIGTAGDQKATLDLQARITAEQGMLQNDGIKLQVLYQGALAEQWAAGQRLREQVIAAHGRFAARFQPAP